MKMIFRYFAEKAKKSNNWLLDNVIQYWFLKTCMVAMIKFKIKATNLHLPGGVSIY